MLDTLIKELLPLSATDEEDPNELRKEWYHCGEMKEGSVCLCGNEYCKELFLLVNQCNGKTAWVGSVCVKHFKLKYVCVMCDSDKEMEINYYHHTHIYTKKHLNNKELREQEEYRKNPNKCGSCDKEFSYEKQYYEFCDECEYGVNPSKCKVCEDSISFNWRHSERCRLCRAKLIKGQGAGVYIIDILKTIGGPGHISMIYTQQRNQYIDCDRATLKKIMKRHNRTIKSK